MTNNNVGSQTQLDWLKKIKEDSELEGALNLFLDSQIFRQKPRFIVWYICEKLNCRSNGVPGQACRIIEWFIVSTVKSVSSQEGKAISEYILLRMLLIVTSSILIAAEINSEKFNVTVQGAHSFLASEGFSYRIEDLYLIGLKILKSLENLRTERHVSPTSSVQLGGILACELGVGSYIGFVLLEVIDLAEKYLYDIEIALNYTDYIRSQNGPRTRVRTLHFAAAGIAAGIKYITPGNGADCSALLANMLNLPVEYIECLRDVILAVITHEKITDPNPVAELHYRMSLIIIPQY